ncbi:MAG: M48 family metalloprotease [Candidatus Binatia bacterium]
MKLAFIRRKAWMGALLLTSGLIGACATGIIPATGEKRYLGFTWEQEQEIGKQARKEIAAAFGIYRDPELESYVERVGRRVLQESHLRRPGTDQQFRDTPITFQILDSPSVNAMAIPGGHVYVTRGMLAQLKNEDQLAVVLGHELAHVTARHAARQVWQQQVGQGLLLGGAIIGQALGLPAEQLLNLGGAAAQLIFLRHSREDELEADRLGVEYSGRAGYDPREVTGFFRALDRMGEKESAALPNFLMTHPNPGDRIERIKQLTAELNPNRQRREIVPADYFEAIEGIILGEDPRQGFVEQGVFYHPELRFRFPVPKAFKLVNQPTQVIMIDNQQRAIVGFRLSAEKSAQSAASKFASQGGIRVLESGRSQSEGLPGAIVVADAKAENNQNVRLMAYFVEHGGRVYHFIAYTAPQAFGLFRSEFLRTMRGFGDLKDPEILRRQPVRLEVERAPRAAPFRELIPTKLPRDMRPEDLAILNQVDLNEEIRSGTLLKIPGRS